MDEYSEKLIYASDYGVGVDKSPEENRKGLQRALDALMAAPDGSELHSPAIEIDGEVRVNPPVERIF